MFTIERVIKNSSGKIAGVLVITEDYIYSCYNKKPELKITDKSLIAKVLNKDEQTIKILYDEYYLTIGEIAALYEVCYSNINKRLKKLNPTTKRYDFRRNSSYGKTFSLERRNNISKSCKGRTAPPTYERTPEIRKKTSDTLKQLYKDGVLVQDGEKQREAWKRGVYDNVNFQRGYSGYFTSHKNKQVFFFRSFLELMYMLQLETNDEVTSYEYEPFRIPKLSTNGTYTPDFLINNAVVVELKAYNFIHRKEQWKKFQEKVKCAESYCKINNYSFKVVYDVDLGFDTASFRKFLTNNPDIIKRFNIEILRDWSLK